MTYPSVGDKGPSTPAGGRDESNAVGPSIQGAGNNPAVIPTSGPAYMPDSASAPNDATYPPGPSAAGIVVPRAVFHDDQGNYVVHSEMTADSSNPPPTADRDGDDGLPDIPRYEGPTVSDAAISGSPGDSPHPWVNPSAGNTGPTESGLADVNPQGAAPAPGDAPHSDRVVYPDTTKDTYPR